MSSAMTPVRRRPCRRTAFIAGVLLSLAAHAPLPAQNAGELWRSLPPTPPLPAARSNGYAPVNGIRMFYAVYGEGSPVLLLHGGPGNSNYWGGIVPILVRNHLQVIVADSRGHGRSTRTAEPYSYELMASDTLALLDLAQIQAMWARQPNISRAQLRQIKVRTAIADGAHDEAIRREHTEYLARSIPGATLTILPDVSHFAMLQNPVEFSEAMMGFLR